MEGTEDALTDDEKRVIDLVVNTFGMYGGKVLEKITHNEKPWMEARKGYEDSIPSSELLPKDRIMKSDYFHAAPTFCTANSKSRS